MKNVFCIFLSLALFCGFTLPASASEYDPEIYITNTYALEEPEKDMLISTTQAIYEIGPVFGNSVPVQRGDVVYGSTVTGVQSSAHNFIPQVYISMRNGNGVLFSEPGDITLRMLARCYQLIVDCTHRDGSHTTFSIDPSTYDNYQVDLKIPNYDADIYIINVTFRAAPSNSDGDYLSCSLQYGYKFNQGDIFHVVSNFFKGFFTNTKNTLSSFFGSITGTTLFDSKVSSLGSAEDKLFNEVGSVNSITFHDDIFSVTELHNAFSFITPVLVAFFENVKFSIILQVTASLYLAVVLLGFVRFWHGSSSGSDTKPKNKSKRKGG